VSRCPIVPLQPIMSVLPFWQLNSSLMDMKALFFAQLPLMVWTRPNAALCQPVFWQKWSSCSHTMTIIAIWYQWRSQMKKSLIVPCNAEQGSEGRQQCLSLWLSLHLNSPHNWRWGSGGNAALMGILPFPHFYLFTLISSLVLFPISLYSFVCVCSSLKLSSIDTVRVYWQLFPLL